MTRTLTPITRDEMITEILGGEKDFTNKYLTHPNLAEHDGYEELKTYLEENPPHLNDSEDSVVNILVLRGFECEGLQAPGLNLPYTWFERSNLRNANFSRANLSNAKFHEANLSDATLTEANLEHACLHRTILKDTDLSGANLTDASFYRSVLDRTNLGGATLLRTEFTLAFLLETNFKESKFLQSTKGLHKTAFYNAQFNESDQEYILAVLKL